MITETSASENYIEVGWQAPSNIALVKYWGKKGDQIPMNPSLSMTLDASVTKTKMRAYKKNSSEKIEFTFRFEGKEQVNFKNKILTYLEKIQSELPFLNQYALEIDSSNTFPHSAGIASSASSMSALALCLLSLDTIIYGNPLDNEAFYQKASYLSRIGSGSACRSIYPAYAAWGAFPEIPGSSDSFAVPLLSGIHPLFANMHDSILIVDRSEKSVSSRAGHSLMDMHPFKEGRLLQAIRNMNLIIQALTSGNWELFSRVTENEALTLHGLMMSSDPGFTLLQPNTLRAIQAIKDFREKHKLRITYTIDAGPNLHIIYPAEDHEPVKAFIDDELIQFSDSTFVIHDNIGNGPLRFI